MADQTMCAENVRAMLTENLNRLRKSSADYFEMLEETLQSSQLPIAKESKHFDQIIR